MTRAVSMTRYGGPDVLVCGRVASPSPGAGDIVIRTIAAAVNHTDLEIRAGNWPIRRAAPFPYVPGVEVLGEVEALGAAVNDLRPGQRVITMMQGLGGVRAERAGGYAERVVVPAETVACLPDRLDPLGFAAVGLAGVTAHAGLRRMGALGGKRILITGAAGGVGSAAIGVARAMGASVTALVSRPEQADFARSLGAAEVILSERGASAPLASLSVDGILDTVGAPVFAAGLAALRPNGVYSLVGAVAGSAVDFDLWSLLRPLTLTGYSSEDLDGPTLRAAVAELADWVLTGRMAAPDHITVPLAEAARAHAMLERRGHKGRILLVP